MVMMMMVMVLGGRGHDVPTVGDDRRDDRRDDTAAEDGWT